MQHFMQATEKTWRRPSCRMVIKAAGGPSDLPVAHDDSPIQHCTASAASAGVALKQHPAPSDGRG
jgi:hypothetical protein